jgi:osmotically-inducible protein OsmY
MVDRHRSDGEIQEAAIGALRRDVQLPQVGLSVRVQQGRIELEGLVSSWTARMRANVAVQRVARGATVVNRVRVRLPGCAREGDDDVYRAVVASLLWHALLPDQAIEVRVSGGHVTLHGQVADQGDRDDAETAVRHLANVKEVTNRLGLGASQARGDARHDRSAS